MTPHSTISRGLDWQVLDALLSALQLSPDETEYEIALDALCELDAAFDYPPPDLAERLVAEFEKTLGLGLDEDQYGVAVLAVKQKLPRRVLSMPTYAPDAFLEMAYEDRMIGDYSE